MTTKEMMKLCERLAGRYKAPQHYDDLVQEGVLKCLTMLEANPEEHPANITREVKRRMHDYLNFDSRPVKVPTSDTARALVRGEDPSGRTTYSEMGLDRLRAVLEAEWGCVDEDTLSGNTPTPEELLQKRQESDIVLEGMRQLDPDHLVIIYRRYFEDMTQDEVALLLGVTRQAVSLKEHTALDCLFHTCNKLLLAET